MRATFYRRARSWRKAARSVPLPERGGSEVDDPPVYLHVASVLTSTQNTHLKPVPASVFPNRTFDSVCFPSIARSPRFFFVSAFPRAGFITRDDEQGDVFVHQSDIYAEGFRSLRNQEPVEFGLEPIGDGRFKATNVRAFPKAGASLSFSPPHREPDDIFLRPRNFELTFLAKKTFPSSSHTRSPARRARSCKARFPGTNTKLGARS